MESEILVQKIADKTNFSSRGIRSVLELLDQGSTIPFIARYRKERTGALDELAIKTIQDAREHILQLEARRETIVATIAESGKLTPELKAKIEQAETLTQLEDLYLPFKPKRRTRGAIAKEKGFEPLARLIVSGKINESLSEINRFTHSGKYDRSEVIDGARDIIAEWMNEDSRVRNSCRNIYRKTAVLTSTIPQAKIKEADKYINYKEFSRPLKHVSSHQYLAIMRGEREGVLKVHFEGENDRMIDCIVRYYNPRLSNQITRQIIREAAEDCFKRLLRPSLETELRSEKKQEADREAIQLFSDNLKQLLMAAPLGEKELIAIDPGYRTGCKLVCLDSGGKLLEETVIYPTEPRRETDRSATIIKQLAKKYSIKAIAVGDGTAGRETAAFIRGINFDSPVEVYSVNENGASVYSASEVAREEFPDKDITVRGAVSIGRRLLDPLAELVKIDPKSIGVGQYQHDVDQKDLKDSLEFTVTGVVNNVGVNINTASPQLLSYVAGIGPVLSRNIVSYREQNGPFKNRKDLLKVPRLGGKAFEQSAGFLRIVDATNPLDNTRIHPESYWIVDKMAKKINVPVGQLIGDKSLTDKINPSDYFDKNVGLETIEDIIKELNKPALDPRSEKDGIEFSDEIKTIDDLREGMVLPAKVNNLTAFGAFVDMGIKENGLIHISNMSSKFVKSPSEVLKIGQKVTVEVLEIDLSRHRIALKLVSH